MGYLIKTNGYVSIARPADAEFTAGEIHAMIDGYFEVVRTHAGVAVQCDDLSFVSRDGDFLLVDDNAKLKGKPLNLLATALYVHGVDDPICGDALFVHRDEIS